MVKGQIAPGSNFLDRSEECRIIQGFSMDGAQVVLCLSYISTPIVNFVKWVSEIHVNLKRHRSCNIQMRSLEGCLRITYLIFLQNIMQIIF
uniref:Uncharacterized protein n=1 Tax=Rhizophora mucronata TaxID=61149 RepID=A0A2P2QRJ6_RHIMU